MLMNTGITHDVTSFITCYWGMLLPCWTSSMRASMTSACEPLFVINSLFQIACWLLTNENGQNFVLPLFLYMNTQILHRIQITSILSIEVACQSLYTLRWRGRLARTPSDNPNVLGNPASPELQCTGAGVRAVVRSAHDAVVVVVPRVPRRWISGRTRVLFEAELLLTLIRAWRAVLVVKQTSKTVAALQVRALRVALARRASVVVGEALASADADHSDASTLD